MESIIGAERFKIMYAISIDKKNERIFEVELLYDDPKKLASDTEELLDNLEEENLGRRLGDLMKQVTEAERIGESSTVSDILKESQAITNRLNTIKNSRFKKL